MGTPRRSNLFLVRLWPRNTSKGSDKIECHGKVQRVVDGQSQQFDSWEGLVDVLMIMVSSNKGR